MHSKTAEMLKSKLNIAMFVKAVLGTVCGGCMWCACVELLLFVNMKQPS